MFSPKKTRVERQNSTPPSAQTGKIGTILQYKALSIFPIHCVCSVAGLDTDRCGLQSTAEYD